MQEHGREPEPTAAPSPVTAPTRNTGAIVKVIIALVLLILFIIFVAQNSQPVSVNLVFVTTEVRLIWVFVACALIGAVVAFLLARPGRRASRRYIKELERHLEERGR
jgi:uncharacterized integral membrane protein